MKEEALHASYRCPNCNQLRNVDELTHLFEWNRQFQLPYIISVLSAARQNHLKWACDSCIQNGSVILGKPEEQDWNGITYPFFTYNNEILKCENCNCYFEFSKEEKKFWYEDLKFIVWSYPKNCLSCRKRIREPKIKNKRLTELINNIAQIDAQKIEEIIDIFLEYGNFDKAKYYLSVLKMRNIVDKDNISQIKVKINSLAQQGS